MEQSPSRPGAPAGGGGARSAAPGAGGVPPPQRNLEVATAAALSALRRQAPDQLSWLGARLDGERWALAVLDGVLSIDLSDGAVRDADGRAVGPWWRVLAMHYLCVAARPAEEPPAVTFADLPGGRAYASVYQQRVIQRLCRKAGKDRQTLRAAGQALGAAVERDPAEGLSDASGPPGGDLVMDFRVFPRISFRLTWYAGDEELPPSAALLMPGNIESFLCTEDIVVLSERLVSRLEGGRF